MRKRRAFSFVAGARTGPSRTPTAGCDQRASEFFIRSVGPDLESWTADDPTYDSRAAR